MQTMPIVKVINLSIGFGFAVLMIILALASSKAIAAGATKGSGTSACALSSSVPWWSSLIAVALGIVGTLVTTKFTADRSLWQKKAEDEIEYHQRSLDEFYGPFVRMLDVTFLLSQDLRLRLNDPDYRMLLRLADLTWFPRLSRGNKVIVEEVAANDAILEKLILEKSGGRVDADMARYLSHAVAHFRMLKRAKEGAFDVADVDMLRAYVFPESLREAVKLQRDHVARRIAILQNASGKVPPAYQPLRLPAAIMAKLPPWPDPPRAPAQAPSLPSEGTTPTA